MLLPNSVFDLTGVALKGVAQDVETTQDVATFMSKDTAAVPTDFTATINWGDGTATTAGIITEDASNTFHVSGTHIYTKAGSFTPSVTIKDLNGALYQTGFFDQTNLVSSVFGNAVQQDPNLINPWGMSSIDTATTKGPIWVSDQGKGLATVYNPNAATIKQGLTVTIPSVGTPSGPTGQVANADTTATDFTIPGVPNPVPSIFLFATLDGTIAGWNPASTGGMSNALTAATVSGASFTGLTQATSTISGPSSFYLYASDITGTTGAHGIDVFDPTFTNVSSTTFAGKFVDPNAVAGYDPYNIALLNGNLYVAYAKPSGHVTAPGGYIDEFGTDGSFIARVYTDATGTNLTGPWGLAIAPAGFGSLAGDLLVGNFGDSTTTAPSGTILAINLTTGSATTLDRAANTPIENPGLWSLLFGNGGSGGTAGTLYISAGIDGQTQGLFAQITPAASPSVTVAAAPLTAMGATIRGTEGLPLTTSSAPGSWSRRSRTPEPRVHQGPTPRRSTGAMARRRPARSRVRARSTVRSTASSAIIPMMPTARSR